MRLRLASMLTLALAVMAAGVIHAESFREGTDYETLSPAGEKSRGDSVEIIEFFSYGCGHCASLEPHLNSWIKDGQPDGTRLVRVPVAWSQGFEALARVYYTADILGVPEDAHQGFFDLIHVDRAQLSLPMIAEFFAGHGADAEQFIETFGSAEVTERVQASKTLTRKYRISGVPAFIVDGAYKVPSSHDGFPRMLETVNYLADSIADNDSG